MLDFLGEYQDFAVACIGVGLVFLVWLGLFVLQMAGATSALEELERERRYFAGLPVDEEEENKL